MPFTRFLVWIVLLVLVLAWRFLWDETPPDAVPASDASAVTLPGGWLERQAEVDEWLRDIAQLGIEGKGKRLVWLPVAFRGDVPRGVLVWWHDGRAERLGYLPGLGEDGATAMVTLIKGLSSGQIVLYNVHNDAELLPRILHSITANWAVPADLVILRSPQAADS